MSPDTPYEAAARRIAALTGEDWDPILVGEAARIVRQELRPFLLANDSDSIAGSCNCLTMSPDIRYHKRGCKYRLISERDALRTAVARHRDTFPDEPLDGEEALWAALDAPATRTPVPESPPCSAEAVARALAGGFMTRGMYEGFTPPPARTDSP